jgi:predicted DNA-binding antitoxin AbrB/MazE fold protein
MNDMRQEFDAVYENGLLRPLVPLNIPDQERVSVTVETSIGNEWLDRDALRFAEAEGDSTIALEEVRRGLATIPGSIAETVITDRGEY